MAEIVIDAGTALQYHPSRTHRRADVAQTKTLPTLVQRRSVICIDLILEKHCRGGLPVPRLTQRDALLRLIGYPVVQRIVELLRQFIRLGSNLGTGQTIRDSIYSLLYLLLVRGDVSCTRNIDLSSNGHRTVHYVLMRSHQIQEGIAVRELLNDAGKVIGM